MQYDWKNILVPEETVQKEYGLSKRYRKAILIITVIANIIVVFMNFFAAVIIFVLGSIYYWYLLKAKHFAFTESRIIFIESFSGSTIISIDYPQITAVEIEQDSFGKKGGWGKLIITTTGTNVPDIQIFPLDDPQAIKKDLDEIRNKLNQGI